MGFEWLVIMLVFAIPLVAIVGGILWAIVKLLKGGGSGRSKERDEEEARLMQEMCQGLEKMEKRVEALETILLDREGKDKT